jgi:hypothetical protein
MVPGGAVNQPDSDEISQGMDRRAFQMPRRLIAVGTGIALIAAVITTIIVTRPSYPHAWCAPVLTQLHIRGKSDQDYAAAMTRLARRDHAPVGKLVDDLRDYAVASSGLLQFPNDREPSGSVAGVVSIFAAVKGDLRVLNRTCGQPAAAYQSDSF